MDSEGTADISPMARFGVTEAYVAEKLYSGLVKLYEVENAAGNHDHHSKVVFMEDARKQYLDGEGNVDWDKVEARWLGLRSVKTSLGNKYFTKEVSQKARELDQILQQRLLNVMMGGLCNDDSSVGVYATRP